MSNILFITSTRIGDAVLSTGVLYRLRQDNPDARIVVACGPAPAPLFRAMPLVDEVIAIPKQRYGLHWLKLWRRCILRPWRLVVDLRGSAISWALPAASRRILFSDKKRVQDKHYLADFPRFMNSSDPVQPSIDVAPSFDSFAEKHIPNGKQVIAIGPTANWLGKQWAAENFAELIDRLTGQNSLFPQAYVAIFGGPGERIAALPVIESIPSERRIDLVEQVDLPAAYACLKRCALYIGNDSGLMHMAAAAGIPTLGLFGPSHESRYHPWGDDTAAIRTRKSYEELVACPNYDHKQTGSLMGSLSVKEVEKAVEELWENSRSRALA